MGRIERRGAEALPAVTVLGNRGPAGTYLLGIRLQRDLEVSFGRFDQGKPVAFPQGDYLYLGSALGRKGASSLAHRLLRHTTRTRGRRPHAIQGRLLASLKGTGLAETSLAPPRAKTRFWHIDYLLDDEGAEISHLIVLCSPERLEGYLADLLLVDSATSIVGPGLGARDRPGSTHLLRVEGGRAWWCRVLERIERSLL